MLSCAKSFRQSSAGAAGGRDDDGVDAPEESLPDEVTSWQGFPPIEKAILLYL
jgi:hypothetical protein